MPAEAFAILAAVLYAATQVFIKLGTRDTSVMTGLMVSLGTGSSVSLAACLVWAESFPGIDAIVLFVVAGMLGAALGRILTIVSVDRLGPAVSVPLQGSIYPVSAVLIGLVFLDEKVGIPGLAGVGLILTGIWLLSRMTPAARTTSRLTPSMDPAGARLRPGIVFPFAAGLAYALADLFRKQGVAAFPEPIVGTAIGVFSGFVFWLIAVLAIKRLRTNMRHGPGVRFFVLSGLTAAAAVLSVIRAFETGEVSTISPIVACQPVPTLILSAIFLRGAERITSSVVLGVVSVVMGVVLILL